MERQSTAPKHSHLHLHHHHHHHPQQQQLSSSEWESVFDDFNSGDPSSRSRWLSLPLFDLLLSSLHRRDFPLPLKLQLLHFLEEFHYIISPSPPSLLESLRSILLIPDHSLFSFKDQAMVSTTSVIISLFDSPLDAAESAPHVAALAEILLTVANRPNHSADRSSRAAACECLRELERAFPGLLSDAAGHIWSLAQAERTHAAAAYILLLAAVTRSIVSLNLLCSPSSILSTSTPLIPFNCPQCVMVDLTSIVLDRDPVEANLREIRRIVAFLLERPQLLTPAATMELVAELTGIAGDLEVRVPAVAALLKVQFSGLLYSYDPILCHAFLILYSRFSDTFAGDDERIIAQRLVHISREIHQPLVFRLLSLHWLLGLPRLADSLAASINSFYAAVFDPLSLKSKKLDLLTCIAACLDNDRGKKGDNNMNVVKIIEDGLVCVSAFKYLPPWSSETSVAFRAVHKFLIGVIPHHSHSSIPVDSTIFRTLKSMLVSLTLDCRGLVPVIASFIDRLLKCEEHRNVGEKFLQTLDEWLLQKLEPGYHLISYFPIFERIAESDTIPPPNLLELLARHMSFLVEKHGAGAGLRSWSQGSRVLSICRIMLVHHHSSRVFLPMSQLLAFTCEKFPDLEVRDNARFYLRMLLCVPGKKLRHILGLGELRGVSSSQHSSTFDQIPSPRATKDIKPSSIFSYIHLERVVPLVVKQTWSLALPTLDQGDGQSLYVEGIKDIAASSLAIESEAESKTERIDFYPEPLRVMDSKEAKIVGILRKHFSLIPDYRHMPGIKINIPCILRFESEPFISILGTDLVPSDMDDEDALPALYAATVTFSSTAKYGSIPPCRVPFLLGEPPKSKVAIVPLEGPYDEDSSYRVPLTLELEPREPMPGLITVAIKANVENGQSIAGILQSINVGIEDMFSKPRVPSDVPEDNVACYNLDLFHALWEACGSSTSTGREIFAVAGGKGAAAINGTRSVKLLEVSAESLISSVERYMAPFVVSVAGDALVNAVRDNGVIRDVVWEDNSTNNEASDSDALLLTSESIPLQLEYNFDEAAQTEPSYARKKYLGVFFIMMFLPPRFHLLFQMEVADISTLVRIRTDHWPCLAYVDDYLESLFLT